MLRGQHRGVLATASVSKGACLWISFGNASAARQPNDGCITFQLPVVASSVVIVSAKRNFTNYRISIKSRELRRKWCGGSGIVCLDIVHGNRVTYVQAFVGFPKAEGGVIVPDSRSIDMPSVIESGLISPRQCVKGKLLPSRNRRVREYERNAELRFALEVVCVLT